MKPDTYECFLNEKPLTLTPTEFSILRILLENKGRVISAEELFHQIWKDEYYSKSNNTITVHIRHLREKMNDTLSKPKYIKTIWGWGIKLKANNRGEYSEFQSKLMERFCVNALLSVAAVILLYLFLWKQRGGNLVITLLVTFTTLEYEQAFYIYHNYFRGYKEIFSRRRSFFYLLCCSGAYSGGSPDILKKSIRGSTPCWQKIRHKSIYRRKCFPLKKAERSQADTDAAEAGNCACGTAERRVGNVSCP